jgi:hypothetical protein
MKTIALLAVSIVLETILIHLVRALGPGDQATYVFLFTALIAGIGAVIWFKLFLRDRKIWLRTLGAAGYLVGGFCGLFLFSLIYGAWIITGGS